jgi:hypothetical protein
VPFLLAERARYYCARSMRASKGQLGYALPESVGENDARSRGNRHPPPFWKSKRARKE